MQVPEEEVTKRRQEARNLIDKILHGTPDGRVDPAIAENLRQHLGRHPFEPDRALMEHLREQMTSRGVSMDAVLPEDVE